MKKVYRISFDKYDGYQYDSFIVVADNEDEVVLLVKKLYPDVGSFPDVDWESGFKVEEIKLNKSDILLGSFNA